MHKRHGIILVALVLLFGAEAYAITTESLDKAIENIEATYGGISDLTASFTQKTYVSVLEKNITGSGEFRWKKPGRFFIEYGGDEPKQYISNNKKIWVYVPGDTQVEVYQVSEKTVSKEALEFIRGFGNIRENFSVTAWKRQGGTTNMTLVPLFHGAPYTRLDCQFGNDNLLNTVAIHNTSGNISTYNFVNIRTNTGLTEDIFKFKKPAGVKEVSAY